MLGFHSVSAAPISGRTTNATAAPSDLSPYAGSKPSLLASRVVRATGSAWVDLGGAAAASSDLSPYAQGFPSFSRRGNPRVISAAWYDPGAPVVSDDLPMRGQALPSQALPRPRATPSYSRAWFDLDTAVAVSSDLSPYAQARTIEAWRRARSSGTVWNSGDDFLPPQDALAAYAQSIAPRVKIARLLGKGTAWVDLVDGIPPVIPPVTGNVSGSGGGGAGRRRVSYEEADQIRRRMRDIEIKRVKSWKDPKRLERQLQQIYADLYESEFRPELPELAQPVKRAEALATFKPDFSPLLKDLTAIRQLLDLYQLFLDDEEAIALLLLS